MNEEQWVKEGVEYFPKFIRRAKAPFRSEQVRAFAEAKGFRVPRDKRNWATVTRVVRNMGLIESTGIERDSNGSFKTLWIKAA